MSSKGEDGKLPDSGSISVPGFVLGARIGRGASSAVWEARQLSTGRTVAVKILETVLSEDGARRRFDRERTVMGALACLPNVVSIIDAGIHVDRPWIAMDLCRRGSLASLLRAGQVLQPDDAATVLSIMAAALAAAHELNVLHCDIKPANIMIDDRGAPALTDFGIARLSAATTTTAGGGYTLDHAPPEVLDHQRPTAAADVYSLGTTVWELLAGRPPFRETPDASLASVVRRILDGELPDLPRDDVPGELVALLRHMTSTDPADRPQSMREVCDAVDRIRTAQGWATSAVLAAAPDPTVMSSNRPVGVQLNALVGEPLPLEGAVTRSRSPRLAVGVQSDERQEEALTSLRVGSARGRRLASTTATGRRAVILGATVALLTAFGGGAVVAFQHTSASPADDSVTPAAPNPTTAAPTTPLPPAPAGTGAPAAGPADVPGVPSVPRPGPLAGTGGQTTSPAGGINAPIVAALRITTRSLPPATVRTAMSATLAAEGGVPPYQWRISAGDLPDGLTLSPEGKIAGTPTSPASARFTVTVTDSAGTSAAKDFTLTPLTPPAIVGDINRDGAVDCADKAIMDGQWGQTGSGLSADLNTDKIVNAQDLSILLSHWTSGSSQQCP